MMKLLLFPKTPNSISLVSSMKSHSLDNQKRTRNINSGKMIYKYFVSQNWLDLLIHTKCGEAEFTQPESPMPVILDVNSKWDIFYKQINIDCRKSH